MSNLVKNVSFYTQGCRLNQSETAVLENSFETIGFQVVPFATPADVVVVNTCTVTEHGDADTRRLVNKINRINPETKIALVGCQAQILKDQLLALKNVQWVVGNVEKMRLSEIILDTFLEPDPQVLISKISSEPFTETHSAVDRHHTRANLKIQDGCDFYCAFCVIPFARGPARSRLFEDILREAKELVSSGHKELVLTGVNIGTYDCHGKEFINIVDALNEIPDLVRVRISSIEPTTIPEVIFDRMADASHNLCRHLHIPLQSGHDMTLKKMARKYNMSEFMEFVYLARQKVPEICIGTDIIVGFPGESASHFMGSCDALRDGPLDYAHVFSYSERQFARSRKLDSQVNTKEIKRRSEALRAISQRKRQLFLKAQRDTHQRVLFEQVKKGFWIGLTDHYVKVYVESEQDLQNQFQKVSLGDSYKDGVEGKLI